MCVNQIRDSILDLSGGKLVIIMMHDVCSGKNNIYTLFYSANGLSCPWIQASWFWSREGNKHRVIEYR
jgi:hypothetical protein